MKTRIIALAVLAVVTIFVIAQSLPISRFPNVATPLDSDLFVLAQTQSPATNKNIRYDQLRGSIRSGMATETYVLTTSNSLAGTSAANGSNLVVVLSGTNILVSKTSTNGTNFYAVNNTLPPGFAALEVQTNTVRLGLVTNLNWTYGMTGSVSSATAILGVDDSFANSAISNALFTSITNLSNFVTSASLPSGSNMLNLQYVPQQGATYYIGTNGIPTTNEARAGLEFSPFWRSLRMGELANGDIVHASNLGGQGSNYWNNTNIGPVSVAFGSNVSVRSAYASIGGGSVNLILTNSKFSVIAGGNNNIIDTNSPSSTIGGGGFNQIYGTATTGNNLYRTISGGSNNIINGPVTIGSFIGGGGDNSILTDNTGFSSIAGGFANRISVDGQYCFIGGGNQNVIGETGHTSGETDGSVICGGQQNNSQGIRTFIGGGHLNRLVARDNDYSLIVGGQSNEVGIAGGDLESKHAFIGGGAQNNIANDCTYGVIVGGANNSLSGGNSNSFIGAGRFNSIGSSVKFADILGGERNTVSGSYGFSVGSSNTVTAARAGAIGVTVTNSTAGSVTVGELISYNTPAVIAGAGSGSTNYTLQVTSPKMLLGSSNVNIVAVMQTISGKTHNWSVNITNLSADTWGISFSSATNRWKFQSWMYGTNAPSVLTNNTLLRLQGESEGTNTLVTYQYFSPAL